MRRVTAEKPGVNFVATKSDTTDEKATCFLVNDSTLWHDLRHELSSSGVITSVAVHQLYRKFVSANENMQNKMRNEQDFEAERFQKSGTQQRVGKRSTLFLNFSLGKVELAIPRAMRRNSCSAVSDAPKRQLEEQLYYDYSKEINLMHVNSSRRMVHNSSLDDFSDEILQKTQPDKNETSRQHNNQRSAERNSLQKMLVTSCESSHKVGLNQDEIKRQREPEKSQFSRCVNRKTIPSSSVKRLNTDLGDLLVASPEKSCTSSVQVNQINKPQPKFRPWPDVDAS